MPAQECLGCAIRDIDARRICKTLSLGAMGNEWIGRLAEDERKRDDVRTRATEAAARKAELVAMQGRRWLDALQAAVIGHVEAFRAEFPGDTPRAILFEASQADGGFAVRKPKHPIAAVSIVPHFSAGSISCAYRFTPTDGMPSREDRLELLFTANGGDTLHLKHQDTGQMFTEADALSEYLLVPVFTGRPR
jgi:hypothetical protein